MRQSQAKLADVVAEGLYIASAATRLRLKNDILVQILAHGEDFDATRFLADARDVLLALADEADDDAIRAEHELRLARRRFTESFGTHDYRSRDVKNLRHRRRQAVRVADELRRRAEDHEELRTLVDDAREAAWQEVATNIDRTLRIEAARPDLEPDYAQMREARMQALQMVDLARLGAHQRAAERVASGDVPDVVAAPAARKVGGVDVSEMESSG